MVEASLAIRRSDQLILVLIDIPLRGSFLLGRNTQRLNLLAHYIKQSRLVHLPRWEPDSLTASDAFHRSVKVRMVDLNGIDCCVTACFSHLAFFGRDWWLCCVFLGRHISAN